MNMVKLDTRAKRIFLIVFIVGLVSCAYSQHAYFTRYWGEKWPEDIGFWLRGYSPTSYFTVFLIVVGFFGSLGKKLFDLVWDYSGKRIVSWVMHGTHR
jgi:hypothetical protein